MAVFAIADLHLEGDAGDAKSMDVFGRRWIGGKEKLKKNWISVVNPEDHIIIPGDISWAMNLFESYNDFAFLDSLPGIKYIGKGNHDFWWATASKMNKFFRESGFSTLNILYNNAFQTPLCRIAGSRGWFSDENNQKTVGEVDWKKIVDRETLRLGMSLEAASKLDSDLPVIAFLHFPPVWNLKISEGIIEMLRKYNVDKCFYGHIHGVYSSSEADFEYEGISFNMISADYLDFCPRLILR